MNLPNFTFKNSSICFKRGGAKMKKLKSLLNSNNSGFTLIELLIVVVIIGLLATVLIAVIDPAAQQNRARDAGVEAAINKIALSVEGFNSAYCRYPDPSQFLGTIEGEQDISGCTNTATFCEFELTNVPLGQLCNTINDYYGDGVTETAQCYYRYEPYTQSSTIITITKTRRSRKSFKLSIRFN